MSNESSKIQDIWEKADRRQACKQYCSNICRGIYNLDNRSAERAIWELFQNAGDQAQCDESGQPIAHIRMTVTQKEFIFAHKGYPFTHDTFSSLVKQTSAKAKENAETVGQYGTGFLTTHSFGREIHINGSLDLKEAAPGYFIDIDNFVLDRVFDDRDHFIKKMEAQLEGINNLANSQFTPLCREWTGLRYQLETADRAAEKVAKGIEEAIKVMPYVMTINPIIGDVEIKDETTGRLIRFSKTELPEENGLKVMQIAIEINGEVSIKKIFYLQSANKKDTIILPLKSAHEAASLAGIAKLFVYYPLLGTEDFGMDAIFHSSRFIPLIERNNIELPVDNNNVKHRYEPNVKILEEMSQMLFDYYKNHASEINNWQDITTLTFDCTHNKDEITNSFFAELKAKWVANYENLPIVQIGSERVSLGSGRVRVYSPSLLTSLHNEDEKWQPAIYAGALAIGNLPNPEHIIKWSETIGTWYAESHPAFISEESIANRLSIDGCEKSILAEFDRFLIRIGKSDLLERFKLLLNQNGQQKRKSELVNASSIPQWLCELVRPFVPETINKFVDNEFLDIIELNSYGRNQLKTDLNDSLTNLAKENFRRSYNPTVAPYEVLRNLARLSMIVRSETETNRETYRTVAMPIICGHLGLEPCQYYLPPIDSEERDLTELPFQHLVENLCLEISGKDSEWIRLNREYILSLHKALSKWAFYYSAERKEGLVYKYAIFPNKLNQPTLASEVYVGRDIPEILLDLHQTVLGKDLRSDLIDDEFSDFCPIKELYPKEVAANIENRLEEGGFQHNSVLDIIDMMDSDENFSQWFNKISSRKAEIFMKQVRPECKESVYRLMKVDNAELLERLVTLTENEDLEEILRLGKQEIQKQRASEADFQYKIKLGVYVENALTQALRDHLTLSGQNITVVNEQGGQD